MTYRFVREISLAILQGLVLTEAVVRGLNYMATPALATPAYSQLELSAPLYVWGIIWIGFGVLGIFGEAFMSGTTAPVGHEYNPRAWPSFLAHSGLAVLFFATSLSALVGVMEREPLYGFVVPFDLVVLGFVHLILARRRKHAA